MGELESAKFGLSGIPLEFTVNLKPKQFQIFPHFLSSSAVMSHVLFRQLSDSSTIMKDKKLILTFQYISASFGTSEYVYFILHEYIELERKKKA